MKLPAAVLVLAASLFVSVMSALAQTKDDKPPVFKDVVLELQQGSKHYEIEGTLRYDRDAIVFKSYGRLLTKKHDFTIPYADIASVRFNAGEAQDGLLTALAPMGAIAAGHRKYLTINTSDGNYTLLQLNPSTHMVALIELERRAKITITR